MAERNESLERQTHGSNKLCPHLNELNLSRIKISMDDYQELNFLPLNTYLIKDISFLELGPSISILVAEGHI